MDASFPFNDVRVTPYRATVDGPAASADSVSSCKAFTKWPAWGGGPGDDDVDDEFFLAAILEMEREERARAGILGRWPFWEIREWAILNPEHAETAFGAGIIAAGVALGLLWHVLSPYLARLGPPTWFCGR